MAFVMTLPQNEIPQASSWRALAPAAGVGALLLLGLVGFRPLQAAAYANLGAVQQSRAELSVYTWPEWPIQDEVRRQIDLSQAITNYSLALELNPQNGTANRRMGMIALARGDYPNAAAYMTAAYNALPWDNLTRQLYGESLIVNGQTQEGIPLWLSGDASKTQLILRRDWYLTTAESKQINWINEAVATIED